MRIIAFQGDFTHNEKRLPGPGASLVYNFLLVVTISPKYVSNCWPKVMTSHASGQGSVLAERRLYFTAREGGAVSGRVCSCSKWDIHCYTWHSMDLMLDNAVCNLLEAGGEVAASFSLITLPYQISAEMKFVCPRMVRAVNQTHTSLFFTSPSLEGPSDGSLTGSNTQAGDLCCNAAILCIHVPHVRGNSCRERRCKPWLQQRRHLWIPPALPLWNPHVSGRTEVLLITQDKLGKG